MIEKLLKTKASRVMGIDCSTKSLAFCIFYNKRPVEWGKILFEGATVFDRIKDASQKVEALLYKFDVDFIAMEGAILANNRNVKVTIDLSLVYGAVLAQLLKGKAKVIHVTPMTWQNAIGNKAFSAAETKALKEEHPDRSASWYTSKRRQVRKQRTLDFVNNKYGMTLDDDDVGDASAIAHYAYTTLTRRR